MYYPCMNCRKEYDKKCINSCDYARSVEVLKEVLLINEPCASVCKNGYPCKGVGFDCDEECENHSLFEQKKTTKRIPPTSKQSVGGGNA